eukprot:1227447-Rhodomonas_salina.1
MSAGVAVPAGLTEHVYVVLQIHADAVPTTEQMESIAFAQVSRRDAPSMRCPTLTFVCVGRPGRSDAGRHAGHCHGRG